MANHPTNTRARRPAPIDRTQDDSWVDQVADQVQALLAEHGLELELVVFYDKVTEVLHASGYDGAPSAYFRGREAAQSTSSEATGPTKAISSVA